MGDLLGQRPVIIMRGQEPVVDADNVYLVVFRDIVLRGGGIQSVPLFHLSPALLAFAPSQRSYVDPAAYIALLKMAR